MAEKLGKGLFWIWLRNAYLSKQIVSLEWLALLVDKLSSPTFDFVTAMIASRGQIVTSVMQIMRLKGGWGLMPNEPPLKVLLEFWICVSTMSGNRNETQYLV